MEDGRGSVSGIALRRVALTWVGLTVLVVCLVVLFLGMRSVMEIGGSCASGGPYQIARPCPRGVAWLVPGSIVVGLIALVVYVTGSWQLPGPNWASLAWPALFLSLGWNFWEYALDPPGGGTEVSWIVCGALFVAMGGVPLLAILASPAGRRSLLWADGHTPNHGLVRATAAASRPVPMRQPTAYEAPTAAISDGVGDLAEDLARLAELHRQGALSDSEFRLAKARRLAGDGP